MKCPRWTKRSIQLYVAMVVVITLLLWTWNNSDDRLSGTTTNDKSYTYIQPTQHQIQHLNQSYVSLPLQTDLSFDWAQFRTWKQDGWTLANTRDSTSMDSSFLQGLQDYTTKGHTYLELDALAKANKDLAQATLLDLTVVIYFDGGDLEQLDAYLEMLVKQTAQPKALWILWTPSSTLPSRAAIASRLTKVITTIPAKIMDISKDGDHYRWIKRLQQTSTSWVWLVDMEKDLSHIKAVPNNAMAYLYLSAHLPDYHDTLLGMNAVLLPANVNKDSRNDGLQQPEFVCLPSVELPALSQPADLLLGAWLIKKSWLSTLTLELIHRTPQSSLPLPYFISYSLRYRLQIPTIALPPPSLSPSSHCTSIRKAYLNNEAWTRQQGLHTAPSALDFRQISVSRHRNRNDEHQTSIMYFVNGPEQAYSLYPLLCRPHRHPLHIVVTGEQHGLSGTTLRQAMENRSDCLGLRTVIMHDLDLPGYINNNEDYVTSRAMDGIRQLDHVLRPGVLLHVSSASSSLHRALSLAYSMSSSFQNSNAYNGLTLINLPMDQVRHALWIADLPLKSLQHWNSISIQLVVITDRRPHSFSRLLQTCGKSYLLGDRVDLTINMEQSADRVTRNLVNSFMWPNGRKIVRHRIKKGGLMPAIVESWYPRDNDDYGVILEDDISVSPLFYTWAKYNILKYRYGGGARADLTRQVFGVSLYSPRNVELHLVGRRPFDPNQVLAGTIYHPRTPYASQVPCSWGAVYFPEHWREFHSFLSAQLDDLSHNQYLNISLPMSRSDRWKKSWKKYFIQLVYLRGYVMIYPNFQDFESFATNHLETGTHVQSEKRVNIIDTFLVPLMQRNTLIHQLPYQRLPDLEQLPVLDLWGRLTSHQALDDRANEWHPQISACVRRKGTFTPDDLLCPFTHIPAWERPDTPATTKKVKVYTMTEVIEPLAYVTATTKGDDGDHEWPISIDVALFSPLLDEILMEPDDQEQDLRLDWPSIKALSTAQKVKI